MRFAMIMQICLLPFALTSLLTIICIVKIFAEVSTINEL